MNGRQIVKDLMTAKEVTNADMAHRLSISQAALWDRLNNKKVKDMPLSLLCEMLAALDYDVLLVPRGKGGKIDGAYTVTGDKPKGKPSVDLNELLSK